MNEFSDGVLEPVKSGAGRDAFDPLATVNGNGDGRADAYRTYLMVLEAIDRLHHQLQEVVKDELERSGRSDINAVQALLLFNIGAQELTAGELQSRGLYLGSNVSYTVKKLVDLAYLNHKPSTTDRRAVLISNTRSGLEVHDLVADLFRRHLLTIEQAGGIGQADLETFGITARRIDRFWSDQVRYRM